MGRAASTATLAPRDLTARVRGDYQDDLARIKVAINGAGEALHDAMARSPMRWGRSPAPPTRSSEQASDACQGRGREDRGPHQAQVNAAVADMGKVTQQNAAASEESSSAAEELSSHSEELAAMVGSFRIERGERAQRLDGRRAPAPRLELGTC